MEQLNNFVPFIGSEAYFPGGELYPRGLDAPTLDAYLAGLSEADQAAFMSPYTVIRAVDSGGYEAVPYHEAFKPLVDELASLLEEAAELAENESFKRYLNLKAQAVRTDRYFEADVAWIEMSGNKYDLMIGPFETYSDGIKGIKAKYEASVEVVDQKASADLEIYKSYLQQMEQNLPIPAEYKSEVKGLTAKFVIVQDIYRGGEAGIGYQAVAANLPNDPEVHAKVGTVKTFWKNMFKARFEQIIKPVGLVLIDESQRANLSDEGFFQFVLMHEICHAVGPRTVKVGPNKGKAANAAIGPQYNAIEECKADIAGLLSLAFLMDEGVVAASREEEFYVSFLGSLFRSIRFGTAQAHGKAALVSLNYLQTQGSLKFNPETGTWLIVMDKFREGVKNLGRELLILLGDGNTANATAFFETWTKVSPDLEASLARVNHLPIDVLPAYSNQWE